MSYRNPNQALEKPIEKLLQGIKEYNGAVTKRIESDGWIEGHIDRINYIRIKLIELQPELARLHSDTW